MRVSRHEFGMSPLRSFRPEWYADKHGGAIGLYIGKWGLTLGWTAGTTDNWSLGMRLLPRLDFVRFSTCAIATLGIERIYITVYHPARDVDSLEAREPRIRRRYYASPR